ncbi:MAG: hypothetical protein IJF92_00115 [Bacilli bacterium]|nr:hypothetical protein [Bacilli bacterium]MBQ3423450.1 hypothetical protein [Romboutsia sp.]
MSGKVTLKCRQRMMFEFMEVEKNYRFIALGKQTSWPVETDPPVPDDTKQELDELIGLQRVDFYKYAKVIPNPTSLDKKVGIYYKGLYYNVTQDKNIAEQEGYTDVMIGITFDRDTVPAIPVNVQFRQVGLYDSVVATQDEIKYGITPAQWNNKSQEDKGMLVAVDNRQPISRQSDQLEVVYILISF